MGETTENEIHAAVREAKQGEERARETAGGTRPRKNWPVASVGLGLGSAALAGAALYAASSKKKV